MALPAEVTCHPDPMSLSRRAVIMSREGMGSGGLKLGFRLLRKYLSSDLERAEVAGRYAFYNGGVKAALLDGEINTPQAT